MPNVRMGVTNKRRRGQQQVSATDINAVIQAAQNAGNVPALRQVVQDLAMTVGRLAEAIGLEPAMPDN
jgi:hypothetical protein